MTQLTHTLILLTAPSQLIIGSRKDGDLEFTKDIVINDCKNRYLLTKGATQQQVSWCCSGRVVILSCRFWRFRFDQRSKKTRAQVTH